MQINALFNNLYPNDNVSSSIRLGSFNVPGEKLFVRTIDRFLDKYPQVYFEAKLVTPDKLLKFLSDKKLDIGISNEKVDNNNFKCVGELKQKFVIAGKPQPKKNWEEF